MVVGMVLLFSWFVYLACFVYCMFVCRIVVVAAIVGIVVGAIGGDFMTKSECRLT